MQLDKSNEVGHPLLTIAVPTFNRAEFLDLCLKHICEECSALSVEQRALVKIYVSNNASTDRTEEIVIRHALEATCEFIAVNNLQNIGGERNVAQCYASATTPYVWVLGDDDVILRGGVKKVLAVLQQHSPDLIYLGNYWFSGSYSEIELQNKERGVSVFSDAHDFAKRVHVMLTFISGMVVRGGANSGVGRRTVIGSNLPQLDWVFPLLRDGTRFVIIKDLIVAAKGGNSGGYGLVKVFGENLQAIAKVILRERPELARVIQNGTIINFFPGFILECRRGETKFLDASLEAGLASHFDSNWRYYFFLWPLIKLPLSLAYRYNQLLNGIHRYLGPHLK